MAKGSDAYGSMGGVEDAPSVTGTGAGYMNVRANADDFGGQVGQALEKAGQTTQKAGLDMMANDTKLAAMATEAKVNDDYANRYVPQAAALRNEYDQLQGQDKVHGYEAYVSKLGDLNKQFVGQSASPYETQLRSGQAQSRIVSEIYSAQSAMAEQQKEFSNQAATNKILADTGYAAKNYNNPVVVEQAEKAIDGTIELQHIDNDMDPNNPEHKEAIDVAKNYARGQLGISMIQSAVSQGDAPAANEMRKKYGPYMPGFQQLAVDDTLHTENMRQVGVNSVNALKNGQPLPQPLGMPPAQVQAVVANTAQSNGLDPNHALTVAMIESNMGQNLGKRGDIGQTGKGGDLPEQANNMVTELKKSQTIATNALGRTAEPWEQYTCYQQGAGGGPALLKADPAARAVDVLAPLYKNPKDALSAVVNNGGNASMSVSDFLGFIKKKYDQNAARAQCDIPPAQFASYPDPVAQKYPFIKKFDLVKVVSPQEGRGYAETWPAGEPGTKDRPRPDNIPMDKNGIEIFKPDQFSDDDIAGEVLHLDPKAKSVRDDFIKTLSPAQISELKRQPDYLEGDGDENQRLRSAADAAIRGYVVNQWPEEERKRFFTDEQKKSLEELKSYMSEDNGPSTILAQAPEPTIGKAIVAPHDTAGDAVQPAASPRGNLDNFDAKYPAMMERANAIPNLAVRDAVIRNLGQERSRLAASATAYSSQLVGQAQKLANDPKFTSMDQVPADMATALLQEHPDTMHYLELRAEQNLNKGAGGVTKDMKEYGPKILDLMTEMNEGKITSPTQLMSNLKNGDITLSGFDRLTKMFTHDPESQAESDMRLQAFKSIKNSLSGANDQFGLKDPKGDALYSQAMPILYKAIDEGKSKGLTMGQLTDPTSPDYIGLKVASLKRTQVQINMDMMAAAEIPAEAAKVEESTAQKDLPSMLSRYKNETDPAKRLEIKQEMIDAGLIRDDSKTTPSVPVAE